MAEEIHNPWLVSSIKSFNFICCPECDYRSKEVATFQVHATENHPRSKVFFDEEQNIELDFRSQIKEEIKTELFYCCPECNLKFEDVSMFQIHALENHPESLLFFTRAGINDLQIINEDQNESPWGKETIEDYQMYCCSICPFQSRENTAFDNHIRDDHKQTKKRPMKHRRPE